MSTLAGREAELGRLLALLEDALLTPPGTGRALGAPVSGDAGIGKSRLVGEVAAIRVERVCEEAQQVLRAAAVEGRRADDDIVRALVRDSAGLGDVEYDAAVRRATGLLPAAAGVR
jgi:predicted ATPase